MPEYRGGYKNPQKYNMETKWFTTSGPGLYIGMLVCAGKTHGETHGDPWRLPETHR